MNTPVNFELAKLLKEKGFDVPVRTYRLEGKYSDFVHEGFEDDYWGDNRIVNWNKHNVGIKPFKGFFSAPTIVEVVMWLYEKQIDVFIKETDRCIPFDRYKFKIFKNKELKFISLVDYETPTEAYEAAINYVLNNLI